MLTSPSSSTDLNNMSDNQPGTSTSAQEGSADQEGRGVRDEIASMRVMIEGLVEQLAQKNNELADAKKSKASEGSQVVSAQVEKERYNNTETPLRRIDAEDDSNPIDTGASLPHFPQAATNIPESLIMVAACFRAPIPLTLLDPDVSRQKTSFPTLVCLPKKKESTLEILKKFNEFDIFLSWEDYQRCMDIFMVLLRHISQGDKLPNAYFNHAFECKSRARRGFELAVKMYDLDKRIKLFKTLAKTGKTPDDFGDFDEAKFSAHCMTAGTPVMTAVDRKGDSLAVAVYKLKADRYEECFEAFKKIEIARHGGYVVEGVVPGLLNFSNSSTVVGSGFPYSPSERPTVQLKNPNNATQLPPRRTYSESIVNVPESLGHTNTRSSNSNSSGSFQQNSSFTPSSRPQQTPSDFREPPPPTQSFRDDNANRWNNKLLWCPCCFKFHSGGFTTCQEVARHLVRKGNEVAEKGREDEASICMWFNTNKCFANAPNGKSTCKKKHICSVCFGGHAGINCGRLGATRS